MDRLTLVGAFGSPYSRKMRAVLRYRRIPFRWILRGSVADRDLPQVPVALIPVLVFPAKQPSGKTPTRPAQAMVDSTPQIHKLEGEFTQRRVVPSDAAVALLDAVVEDYADEWLTKAMFHFRWSYPADARKASRVLPLHVLPMQPHEQAEAAGEAFCARQTARLGVVGSSETTRTVIEESYRRLLGVLDARLGSSPFVMGARPGAADFGLFGQLTQLCLFDPTPSAIAAEIAPRVVAWVENIEDLSSYDIAEDTDWVSAEAAPDTLRPLLKEIGRTYVPFLLANHAALQAGTNEVGLEIGGRVWKQNPFRYQGKCFENLRAAYAALSERDADRVDAALAGTGCENLFADAGAR